MTRSHSLVGTDPGTTLLSHCRRARQQCDSSTDGGVELDKMADATLVTEWKYRPAKVLRSTAADIDEIGELSARELPTTASRSVIESGRRSVGWQSTTARHSRTKRSHDMSSSKVFHHRALIVVFAVIMAAVMWPVPASAQYNLGCGFCKSDQFIEGTYHRFSPLGYFYVCDTNKGCHSKWYPGSCGSFHSLCYIFAVVDDVESAVAESDYPKLKEVLESSDNWEYDPTSHALSFTCSGHTVARYVLPEELRRAVALLPTTERTDSRLQEPASDKAGTRS